MLRDTKRKRNATLSRQGKDRADQDQCPKCKRKSALRRIRDSVGLTIWCYWMEKGLCDYEDYKYMDGLTE